MTSPIKKEVIIGDCRLLLGDCLEIMPLLGKVDSTITDTPYGVNLGNVKNGQSVKKNQKPYGVFNDTPEYVKNICVPAIEFSIKNSRSVAVTVGSRCQHLYPRPDDMGGWWNPAGTSRGKWGFQLIVTPIFYYGKDPRAGKGSTPSSPVGIGASREAKGIGHPCPKPLSFMKWLVNKASLEREVVLDPFAGSGTTLVSCAISNRRGIGIELDPDYFEIACERVRKAYEQPDLLIEAAKSAPEIQDSLL
jgi:DNA modification methylase